MTGLEYERIRQNLSVRRLAAISGVCALEIAKLETDMPPGTSIKILSTLADALGVNIDDLYRQCDETEIINLLPKVLRPSEINNPGNCVANYRVKQRMTYLELAKALGLSTKESGRSACKRPIAAEKHIKCLAAREGLSVEDFKAKYTIK